MTTKKEHLIFISLFSVSICLVFWKILFLKETFIKGDYLQQFYPWLEAYARSIKNFELPLWIKEVQCGFPLVAEGQIGAFYPLNLGMFFLLPFRMAYNYSFLVHFVLAGVFTYLYARKIGADIWGGALAAILLCFGSAYAGCFVHIATLKCLTWFPLVLFLYEERVERKAKGPLFLAAMAVGMQLLSGSFQMAFYSIICYLLYFFYRNRLENRNLADFIIDASVVFIPAIALSVPQVVLTGQMAACSNRSFNTADFALWNSFSPLSLFGLFVPYIGMMFSKSNVVFISVTGLFFAVYGAYPVKEEKAGRALAGLFLFSVFLAMGKFNPAYAAAVKAAKFYAFRAPSRLIYFAAFSAAVLAGVGFSRFFRTGVDIFREKAVNIFKALSLMALGVFFLSNFVARSFGKTILRAAKEYAAKHVYGKPFHRYTLDTYMAKVEDIFDVIAGRLSFDNKYTLISVLIVPVVILLITLVLKRKSDRVWRAVCVMFIGLELFFFSSFSRGIRPELGGFEYAEPKENRIVEILRSDKELFRICPFGEQKNLSLWLRPSMNILYGVDSVGLYSPLANRDYFLETLDLGIVDDSVGIVPPMAEKLYAKIDLLKRMNVKYAVSSVALAHPSLELLAAEGKIYLYRLGGYYPKFSFSRTLEDATIEPAGIDLKMYRSGYA